MSILKKVFGLSLIGIVLVVSLPADAKITTNKLSANKLSANAFNTNAGEGAFNDEAAVELPNGICFTR